MAAALDYCMRGVGVPLALLVSPISNSLLPEIARLRSLLRMRDAFRLIDRTVALTALVAVGGCAFALLFRHPAIALFFQRGNFTAESTRLVAAVFLGLGPSLDGLDAARDHVALAVRAGPSLAAGDRGGDSGAVERGDYAAVACAAAGIDRRGRDGGRDGGILRAIRDGAYGTAEVAGAGVRRLPLTQLSRILVDMEVHFTAEQEAQLAQVARYAGKSDAVELLQDAALRLLDEDARFRAAALEGKSYADRAEFVEEDEMDARFEEHAPLLNAYPVAAGRRSGLAEH